MSEAMKITVMGAGAVGAYLGARLAVAGQDVGLVTRGAHLAALRERGLEVQSALGDVRLKPVRATDRPADIGESDVVLFTVKGQDTDEAVRAIEPLVGNATRVLTLQNGVGGVDALTAAYGLERVWGGVTYIEAFVTAPGVVAHKSPFARVVFGALQEDARVEGFRQALEQAGVTVEVAGDVQVAIWSKWLLICAFSGVTALTRRPIGVVLALPETRALLLQVMEEIEALARARGVGLPSGIVASTMAFMGERFEPSMTSSLAQDLAAGKRLETDALNGAASRLGEDLGVPTPANDFIAAALRPYRDGGGGA